MQQVTHFSVSCTANPNWHDQSWPIKSYHRYIHLNSIRISSFTTRPSPKAPTTSQIFIWPKLGASHFGYWVILVVCYAVLSRLESHFLGCLETSGLTPPHTSRHIAPRLCVWTAPSPLMHYNVCSKWLVLVKICKSFFFLQPHTLLWPWPFLHRPVGTDSGNLTTMGDFQSRVAISTQTFAHSALSLAQSLYLGLLAPTRCWFWQSHCSETMLTTSEIYWLWNVKCSQLTYVVHYT